MSLAEKLISLGNQLHERSNKWDGTRGLAYSLQEFKVRVTSVEVTSTTTDFFRRGKSL